MIAPEHCLGSHQAVRFYWNHLKRWRTKLGATPSEVVLGTVPHCPRHLAHVLQRKAHAARLQYQRWLADEWHWQRWLPVKFYRVARCETGVDWAFDSGTYVSSFGIVRVAYEQYHHWTGHNTPREQYEVAAAIQRRFGWGAWGCGSA